MEAEGTYLGFGFGPIQAGLFLLEAANSSRFSRLVVAEVDDAIVSAVRRNEGRCTINIAHQSGIEQKEISGIDVFNPRKEKDRRQLVRAAAAATEAATCLPSIHFYDGGDDTCVCSILAKGISGRTNSAPLLIYASENHNEAAEHLLRGIHRRLDTDLAHVQAVNTVIGKMSGVISEPERIRALGLQPMTPDLPRAVLVEAFNRILISQIQLDGFRPGIQTFIEKDDLLPFEEAKLYGHNAVHALMGYLAAYRGFSIMSEVTKDTTLMSIVRDAFLLESGTALRRRYKTHSDPLFSEAGFSDYASDLIIRMTNPYLNDLVSRICRDPNRKLGFNDRLFGTMRLALAEGIRPVNMALGAAAALVFLGSVPGPATESLLTELWADEPDTEGIKGQLIDITLGAAERLPHLLS